MVTGDDVTLPDTVGVTPPGPKIIAPSDLGTRYEVGNVIGRGGMGEVRLARDKRIDREVAVKLLRKAGHEEIDLVRFFREARVQGVLDHPAVVPVHDLGIDSEGNPYFVMKKLGGTTLADVLASTDPELAKRWPRRQLLARFVDICLAIEFAHERGVIHRDLKPANIMLGDYGEAYVLDWGLARISTDAESLDGVLPLSGDREGQTVAGTLLGTPGYMSPEQARGEDIDPRTDVFALGCVLYEILAGKPALPRGLEAIAGTLAALEHRPSTVAPETPPELDDLCARATRANRDERMSARKLADKIQAYLDGDRDVERRLALAESHAEVARDALAGLVRGRSGTNEDASSDDVRATAMREAGRALAIDPSNTLAQEVLAQLMLAAPSEMPAEALDAAEAERAEMRRALMRTALVGYIGAFAITVLLLFLPLRAFWPVAITNIICIANFLVARHLARHVVPGDSLWFVALLFLSSAMFVGTGMMFGPLLILPVFMVGAIAGFLAAPSSYHWTIPTGAFVVPFVCFLVLELVGVIPRTISFDDGHLVLSTWTVDLTPLSTALILGLPTLTMVTNVVVISRSRNAYYSAAGNQLHAQSWHLRQLLPRGNPANRPASPNRDRASP